MSILITSRFQPHENPTGGPWGPRMTAVAREAIESRQIAILRDISQGWGAATTLEETMASIVRSTHAALDSPDTLVRLLLPSASNRLRVRMSVPHKLEGSQWRGRR